MKASPAGLLALASSACALTLAFFTLTSGTEEPEPRGALEVAGAFVYHIDHGNFGKACGLYAQDARVDIEGCSEGFVFNVSQAMMFLGEDIYDGARIVPGSRVDVDEDTVSFVIVTDLIEPATLTVERQPSGRWRITEIKG